jgi:triosephosphate isomerase
MGLTPLTKVKTTSEIVSCTKAKKLNDVIAVLNPPFPHLFSVKKLIGDTPGISVGAQNCSEKESGAFTGEVSVKILASFGVDYVIIGHSERRGYFKESNEILAEKVKAALANGLIPIFCCGESLDIRNAGTHEPNVKFQLTDSLFSLNASDFSKVVIAYEPIWAIGTGKTATSDEAQEMHLALRRHIASKYGKDIANKTSILYGGSMNAGNAADLLSRPDVDELIGGASLKSRDFLDIIKSY